VISRRLLGLALCCGSVAPFCEADTADLRCGQASRLRGFPPVQRILTGPDSGGSSHGRQRAQDLQDAGRPDQLPSLSLAELATFQRMTSAQPPPPSLGQQRSPTALQATEYWTACLRTDCGSPQRHTRNLHFVAPPFALLLSTLEMGLLIPSAPLTKTSHEFWGPIITAAAQPTPHAEESPEASPGWLAT